MATGERAIVYHFKGAHSPLSVALIPEDGFVSFLYVP